MRAILSLTIITLLLGCKQAVTFSSENKDAKNSITIDTALRDSLKQHIQLISDRYSSYFKTPIDARFLANGMQMDSIIESDFEMDSYYHSHGDTIDLVAHVGIMETFALLIRFIKTTPQVFFYRAPHDNAGSRYFRVNKTDSFTHDIYVKPTRYELKLSEIPDTVNKQIVYGHINLESGDYFDKRDTTKTRHKIQMQFYFRSQYKKFDY